MRHRASVYISYELLEIALGIREGVRLVMAISQDDDKLSDRVQLVFEHPSLPAQPEGAYPAVANLEDVTR